MALDPKQEARRRPYPPLGTLYAAAVLRAAGWEVALFDATLAAGEAEFAAALRDVHPRLVVLYEDSFHWLSKMCLARMRQAAHTMIGMAREQGAPVLVSGSDATDDPAAYLAAGASAVVLGEGELGTAEAAGHLLAGRDASALRNVAGLALVDTDGAVLRTPRRPATRQPDSLPLPARDLVDVAAYRSVWMDAHGYYSVNMVASRGCPFHCNWCAKPIWGQGYAQRDPRAVAEELLEIKRTIRPDHIWFADDIFGIQPAWTARFGQAVAQLGAQIPFQIQTRVDLLSEEAADGLAQAGCVEAWLGVESGSQRVLDAMEKGLRAADVPRAVTRLRERGIRVCFFLQLGYPGERWADILLTAGLVRETLPDDIGVSVSYPLPGTKFYDRVKTDLGDRHHWRDSRDLAMLFAGQYTTAFYRQLHDVLHRELSARQAISMARHGSGDFSRAEAELAAAMATWQALEAAEPTARSERPTALAPAPGDARLAQRGGRPGRDIRPQNDATDAQPDRPPRPGSSPAPAVANPRH